MLSLLYIVLITLALLLDKVFIAIANLVNNPAPARRGERARAPIPARLEATRRLCPACPPSYALLGDPLCPTWC